MSSNAESQTNSPESSPATARIKDEIEHTRSGLSDTVAALEEKLAPSQVREVISAELQLVEDRVKNFLRDGLNDAERMVRAGLGDARESVRQDATDALIGARNAIRAATLGKVETFATTLGDSMNDVRDTLLDTVYKNPLPATLTGVGLAWLLMNRSRSARRSSAGNGSTGASLGNAGTSVGKAAHQATDALAEGVHGATDAAGEVLERASGMVSAVAQAAGDSAQQAAQTAREGATALASSAQQSAKRVEQIFERQLRQRPLAVGAAALAIGTMVGCALPRTHAEDELMGERRDDLLDRAGDAVDEVAGSVTKSFGQSQTDDESSAVALGDQ